MPQLEPLISVLITSYNHERFIRRAVDSVLNQTYPHVEITVVDDCSTDDSPAILRSYGDRFRLVEYETNHGIEGYCETVNHSIRTATGEFFYRLDSDDFIEPDYFERMVGQLRGDPQLDWICGGLNVVDASDNITDCWRYADWPTEPEAALARGWQTCSVVMPHNGLLRTSFLRDNNLYWRNFPYGWGADVLFTIRSMLAGARVRLIPDPGFNWRAHGSNNSCNVDLRVKLVLAVIEYYFEHITPSIYLHHPLLNGLDEKSDDYRSAVCALIAENLLARKHNFRVPAMFQNGLDRSATERALGLFDPLIRTFADRALVASMRFRSRVDSVLQHLSADAEVTEGRRSLRLGLLQQAACHFQKALEKNDRQPDALSALGEIAFTQGDLDSAAQYSSRALQINPKHPQALNNAGVILFSKGDLQQAEQALLQALAVDPGNNDAHRNFVELYGNLCLRLQPDPGRRDMLLRSLRWLSEHAPDNTRLALLTENHNLRDTLLNEYTNRYRDARLRVLLHRPSNGALRYLMDSWAEVLNHMGITTALLDWGTNTAAELQKFQPTVFVTVDDPTWNDQIDLTALKTYRSERGLKVGRITTLSCHFAPVDFYITFHLDPTRDPSFAILDKPLLSLPFAVNPLRHYMRPAIELWDFFFVGTNSHLKVEETRQYLAPVLENYRGVLAGVNWNVGLGELPMTDAALLYNFAAISPNFHMKGQHDQYNELNERTYIIPACGGFELVDQPKAMTELFAPDEMAVADSPSAFRDMFAHFLEHPDERIPYIRGGMHRVYLQYTLFHVLDRLAVHLTSMPEPAVGADQANS